MGLFDKFKKQGSDLQSKASDLADEHGDKINAGIDKAGDLADKATGGKISDQIDGAVDKAKGAVDNLGNGGSDNASA